MSKVHGISECSRSDPPEKSCLIYLCSVFHKRFCAFFLNARTPLSNRRFLSSNDFLFSRVEKYASCALQSEGIFLPPSTGKAKKSFSVKQELHGSFWKKSQTNAPIDKPLCVCRLTISRAVERANPATFSNKKNARSSIVAVGCKAKNS